MFISLRLANIQRVLFAGLGLDSGSGGRSSSIIGGRSSQRGHRRCPGFLSSRHDSSFHRSAGSARRAPPHSSWKRTGRCKILAESPPRSGFLRLIQPIRLGRHHDGRKIQASEIIAELKVQVGDGYFRVNQIGRSRPAELFWKKASTSSAHCRRSAAETFANPNPGRSAAVPPVGRIEENRVRSTRSPRDAGERNRKQTIQQTGLADVAPAGERNDVGSAGRHLIRSKRGGIGRVSFHQFSLGSPPLFGRARSAGAARYGSESGRPDLWFSFKRGPARWPARNRARS